jgi:hypothetical protein
MPNNDKGDFMQYEGLTGKKLPPKAAGGAGVFAF